MLHKVSIRWRMTILSALLLSVCCVILTLILNYSANRLVDQMDAITLTPAVQVDPGQVVESIDANQIMIPAQPTEVLQEAQQGFRYDSLLYMLFIIFGGSALTYYITGKALKPLHSLHTQVKQINAQNLSTSISIPSTKDEIAELSVSFNDMMNQINEAFLTQKRFSASAAHELRTPLAILQTKVDVFKKKQEHTTKEYDDLLEIVEKQLHRLRALVGSLLALSNEAPLEKSEFDVTDTLMNLMEELSTLASQKNIELSLVGEPCSIYGDVDGIYRVFYNLIENAIKYNIEEGTVKIEIEKVDSFVKVSILDSGIGIPDDLKRLIFEPFYTVDTSRSRKLGGVGLGLALTHQIIKKHQGTICVKDHQPKGSCFEVCLPSVLAETKG